MACMWSKESKDLCSAWTLTILVLTVVRDRLSVKLNKEYHDDDGLLGEMQHSHFYVIIGGHVLVKPDGIIIHLILKCNKKTKSEWWHDQTVAGPATCRQFMEGQKELANKDSVSVSRSSVVPCQAGIISHIQVCWRLTARLTARLTRAKVFGTVTSLCIFVCMYDCMIHIHTLTYMYIHKYFLLRLARHTSLMGHE
jgi:hypothetical protein